MWAEEAQMSIVLMCDRQGLLSVHATATTAQRLEDTRDCLGLLHPCSSSCLRAASTQHNRRRSKTHQCKLPRMKARVVKKSNVTKPRRPVIAPHRCPRRRRRQGKTPRPPCSRRRPRRQSGASCMPTAPGCPPGHQQYHRPLPRLAAAAGVCRCRTALPSLPPASRGSQLPGPPRRGAALRRGAAAAIPAARCCSCCCRSAAPRRRGAGP